MTANGNRIKIGASGSLGVLGLVLLFISILQGCAPRIVKATEARTEIFYPIILDSQRFSSLAEFIDAVELSRDDALNLNNGQLFAVDFNQRGAPIYSIRNTFEHLCTKERGRDGEFTSRAKMNQSGMVHLRYSGSGMADFGPVMRQAVKQVEKEARVPLVPALYREVTGVCVRYLDAITGKLLEDNPTAKPIFAQSVWCEARQPEQCYLIILRGEVLEKVIKEGLISRN